MLWRNLKYLGILSFRGFENPDYVLRIGKIVLGAMLVFLLFFWLLMPDGGFFPPDVKGKRPLYAVVAYGLAFVTHPAVFFLAGMGGAWFVAYALMVQIVSALYDIPMKEAEGFVMRLFYGLPKNPPKNPTLVVREGQIDPEAPEVLRKLGGPAFISVGLDSAVVLSRRGRIVRAVGPGFHTLEAFEKVWDVVDLRPQRREVKVETYTRDGIPVCCEAEIRFDLSGGEELWRQADSFTKERAQTVLRLTTEKVVLGPEKDRRFTPWSGRMYKAILDGKIRDWIEQYRLDDLISPASAGEPMITRLQEEVEAKVREEANPLGVWVDGVEITSLRPSADHISEQWLKLWRSEWDRFENELKAEAKALGNEQIHLARLKARARLLTEMLPEIEGWGVEDMSLLKTLEMSQFMEAVQAMSDIPDPIVRSHVFHQAKELHDLVRQLGEEIKDDERVPEELPQDESEDILEDGDREEDVGKTT